MSSLIVFPASTQTAFEFNYLARHPIIIAFVMATILSVGLPMSALYRCMARSSSVLFATFCITVTVFVIVSVALSAAFIYQHALPINPGIFSLRTVSLPILTPYRIYAFGILVFSLLVVHLQKEPVAGRVLIVCKDHKVKRDELHSRVLAHSRAEAAVKEAELTTKISTLEATIRRLEAVVEKDRAAAAEKEAVISEKEAVHEEIKAALDIARSSEEQSKITLRDLEAKFDTAKKEMDTLKNAVSQQDRKLATYTLNLKKRDAECAGLMDKVKRFQSDLEARDTRIWELEAQLETAAAMATKAKTYADAATATESDEFSQSFSVVESSEISSRQFRPPVDSNTTFVLAGLLPWSQSSSDVTESSMGVSFSIGEESREAPVRAVVPPTPAPETRPSTTIAKRKIPRTTRAMVTPARIITQTVQPSSQPRRATTSRTQLPATRKAQKENVPPPSVRAPRQPVPSSSKVPRLSPPASTRQRQPLASTISSQHTAVKITPSGLRLPPKRAGAA